jgi:hypothetical protein
MRAYLFVLLSEFLQPSVFFPFGDSPTSEFCANVFRNVPTKFRWRKIAQKEKIYNIRNTANVWTQEYYNLISRKWTQNSDNEKHLNLI